eukprot:scaffold182301_cov33-Tisochrysis_lutea.AAC.1
MEEVGWYSISQKRTALPARIEFRDVQELIHRISGAPMRLRADAGSKNEQSTSSASGFIEPRSAPK